MFSILIIQELNNKFQEIEKRNNKNLKLKKLRTIAQKNGIKIKAKLGSLSLGMQQNQNHFF